MHKNKKKIILSIFIIVIICGFIKTPVSAGVNEEKVLNINLYNQAKSLWCWVATSKMMIDHLTPAPHLYQSELVTQVYGSPINTSGDPSVVLENNGFSPKLQWFGLSYNDIKNNIDNNLPIETTIIYKSALNMHSVLIYGYYHIYDPEHRRNEHWIVFWDPNPSVNEPTWMRYEDFCNNPDFYLYQTHYLGNGSAPVVTFQGWKSYGGNTIMLTATDWSSNGAVCKGQPYNNNWSSQEWKIETVYGSKDYVRLKNVYSNRYLNDPSESENVPLVVWDYKDGWWSEQWKIILDVNGSNGIMLRNRWTSKMMLLCDPYKEPGDSPDYISILSQTWGYPWNIQYDKIWKIKIK